MSFHRVSKWVIDQIDKMRRSFLWEVGRVVKIFHFVHVLLDGKKCAGQKILGILNLRQMNQALLGKRLWRYFKQSDLTWRRLIQHKNQSVSLP